MTFQDKRFMGIMLTVALLLIVPLIGMEFTNEVNWTLFDFIIAGVLLFGTGILFEFILRKIKRPRYRVALIIILLLIISIVWVELAVGIFSSRFAGQ